MTATYVSDASCVQCTDDYLAGIRQQSAETTDVVFTVAKHKTSGTHGAATVAHLYIYIQFNFIFRSKN